MSFLLHTSLQVCVDSFNLEMKQYFLAHDTAEFLTVALFYTFLTVNQPISYQR